MKYSCSKPNHAPSSSRMVARLFEGCGVLPSGIMTSHITRTPLVRAASGKTRTGFRTQSELFPSACMVELPSKPHSGSCSSVGSASNSLICVLPRRFGIGVYPSSQIYSSLYFVIELSHELMMRKVGNRSLIGHHERTRPPSASFNQAIKVPIGTYGNFGQEGETLRLLGFGSQFKGAAKTRGLRFGQCSHGLGQAQMTPDFEAVGGH